MERLNNDIYEITQAVTDIQQRYIDEEDPDTLALGIFGYFADIQSLSIQNSIISTGELGNELFPARAKYERNLLSHAVINNVDNINAVPSTINCLIGVFESDFDNYAKNDMFYLDKEIAIYVDNKIEFHLDYDIIIKKNYMTHNNYAYTAQYNITLNNPLSNITNPYLNAPVVQYYNGSKVICFYATMRQVTHTTIHKKIITNNIIENKTLQFSFNDQLADFVIKATDGGTITYITPIMEGIGVEQSIENYCYYSYLDATHIQVRFDSSSYIPKLNTDIDILIKTTIGIEGNFEYNKTQYPMVNSTIYGYNNVPLIITFGGEASGGLDRITTDELRRVLPKESLSRGSIICQKDLDNHFSMYNTDSNRLIVQKRVDNQFERSYYTYFLLKDPSDNVIPTNTFDIIIQRDFFDTHDNRKYVLKPGCYIKLREDGVGVVVQRNESTSTQLDELQDNDKDNFLYTIPFMLVVTGDPLYVSYYLAIIDDMKYLDFTYINMQSILQFIAVNVYWSRGYTIDPNIYKLQIQLTQNYPYEKPLIIVDENGNVIEAKIKVFAVFYNSDNSAPYRYVEATLLNTESGSFNFEADLETTDIINDDNKVRINNVHIPGTGVVDYGYFSKDLTVKIYTCVKLEEGEFGRYDLDGIVPGLNGYTVTNMYTVDGGLSLYVNYSNIIHSQTTDITIENEYTDDPGFRVTSVPCVRRSYVDTDVNMDNFVSEINYKKAYIDNALEILDSDISIDFKFFNTYGPSQTYTIDREGITHINRVNLTLNFALKLISSADKNTKDFIISDIKEYVEDLNDISSLHIPNLITQITTDYRQLLEYFEFLGFNDYGPGVQHLYRNESNNVKITPEFLTIHTNLNMSPDISIRLD